MERRRALLAELRSYIGLTDEDAELLRLLRPVAQPHFRAIADEFYAAIRIHENAFAVLKDEAQAQRLHASLQVWLGDLLGGTYDDAWLGKQFRIGRVHVNVGLDLRYMVTAMSRVRVWLQRIAGGEGTRLAVARICDLDLAIMLESYKADLVDRIERVRMRENEDIRTQFGQRERLFQDVLEAADMVVLGFDSAGRLTFANPRAEQLSGYARDELAVGDVFEMLFAERAAAVRATLFEAAARGEAAELETETRTRAGKKRTVRWHASTHRADDAVDAPSVVMVGVDVTRERDLERRARMNERLAAAGALAAGLAHEIRNPLNGASLHLSVLDRALARSPDVPDAAREATGVLRAEIRRLSALVTDFLDVARPKPLARAPVDLNDVAQSVHALLVPEAEARKIRLALEAFPFPATAHVDSERTKQVLVNLVRNAIEAAKEGGNVVLRVRRLPHEVEIDVEDDGPGIPDPAAPIFDAFFTTKDRGTGLGLSIVQRIVTDHGGEVTFASRPGSTTFTVRMPITPQAVGPAGA
jgi:PAS domain S-box-containing protein